MNGSVLPSPVVRLRQGFWVVAGVDKIVMHSISNFSDRHSFRSVLVKAGAHLSNFVSDAQHEIDSNDGPLGVIAEMSDSFKIVL